MTAERMQQLVGETVWLRRLARTLVADAAAADDLVHDAVIAAAVRPPPDDRPLRPWLARVITNLARMRGRSATRRSARELRAHEPREVERPDELVEHLETQQLLGRLVLELGEPYRDVLLLHFFDGLTSVEIGRRLGISDGTVRWRLKYALDELRARLADQHTQRGAWIAPLAGFAGTRGPLARGAFLVKKIVVAAAVVIALLIGWWVARADAPRASTPPPVASVAATVPAWVVQAEAPARRIAGRVVRGDVPVRVATVALRVAAQPDVIVDERIARDGTFDFGARPPADYVVTARGDDASPAIVHVSTRDPRSSPDRLYLVLGDCAWRLFGNVTDAARTPLAGAFVRLHGLVGAITDEHGAYSLCRARSSLSVPVTVGADGYGSVFTQLAVGGSERRDFVLAPEGVLDGRVVTADGAPVAGAQVLATPVDRAQLAFATRSATSGSDGRFHIAGFAPGRIAVTARTTTASSEASETTIEAGGTHDLVVVVQPTTRVRGSVTTPDGAAVAGAEVTVITPNGRAAQTAWSQADGAFVVDGVPTGQVTWAVRGYSVITPSSTLVTAAPVRLTVTRQARISGRILHHGMPVADAAIQWSDGTRDAPEITSDATGRYEFVGIPAGTLMLLAYSTPLGAYADQRVTVGEGAALEVDLELDRSASISGSVVDEHGAPVPYAFVTVAMNGDSGETLTDASGAFTLGMLAGGMTYVVQVWPSAAMLQSYPTTSGELGRSVHVADATTAVRDVVVAVRTTHGAISGRVVDDLGAPVGDVRVELTGARGHGSTLLGPESATITDPSGAFTIDGVVAGAAFVRARGADGAEVRSAEVHTGARDVTLVLPRAGTLDVTLAGFSALPRVIVAAQGTTERSVLVENGRAQLRGLRAGSYVVAVEDGERGDVRTVEVVPGATTRIELRDRGTAQVSATVVVHGSDAPVVGARCVAAQANGWPVPSERSTSQLTDERGVVTFRVPASRVRIHCVHPQVGFTRALRELDVPANTVIRTRLRIIPTATPGGGEPGFNLFTDQLPFTVGDVFANARAAGLRSGDIVRSIGGVTTEETGPQAGTLLLGYAKGEAIVLGIERAGVALTITIIAS